MGGNAAKERRRQKRLEQAKQHSTKTTSDALPTTKTTNNVATATPKSNKSLPNGTNTNTKVAPTTSTTSTSSNKVRRITTQKPKTNFGTKQIEQRFRSRHNNERPTPQKQQRKTNNNTPLFSNNNNNNNNRKRRHANPNPNPNPNHATKKTKPSPAPIYKKPKHLSRKLRSTNDPIELQRLQKLQEELHKVKTKRQSRFESRVIELVGGKKNFDEKSFWKCMENGGGDLDTIVGLCRIDGGKGDGGGKDDSGGGRLTGLEQTASCGAASGNLIEPTIVSSEEADNDDDHDEKKVKKEKEIKKEKVIKKEEKGAKDVNVVKEEKGVKTNKEVKKENEIQLREKEVKDPKVEKDVNEHDPKMSSPRQTNPQPIPTTNESDEEEEDGADKEESYSLPTTRTRGRRRRGRIQSDIQRNIQNEEQQRRYREEEENVTNITGTTTNNTEQTSNEQGQQTTTTTTTTPKTKKPKKQPLESFQIGKTYTGTVVYIKPTLGIFLNVNCYKTDAFVHISRVTDDYIETITDDICKVGDVLTDRVRITDIDLERRKLTASLQSEEMVEMEMESARSRRERTEERRREKALKQKLKKKRKREELEEEEEKKDIGSGTAMGDVTDNTLSSVCGNDNTKPITDHRDGITVDVGSKKHVAFGNDGVGGDGVGGRTSTDNGKQQPVGTTAVTVFDLNEVDVSNMTPAELKRHRKLQRRAERRMQNELEDASS